ncbi:MAG: sugar kinase [Sphaerochaetaceae bacterium]
MAEIWTMGELLVEIMRPEADIPFDRTDRFLGPFPSGAPAIFIDTAAKLGMKAGMIGGVGADGFGLNVTRRLKEDGVDCRYIQTLEGTTGVAFITYSSDGSREYIFHLAKTPAVGVKMPENLEVGDSGFFHLMGCSLFMDSDFTKEILATMKAFVAKGYRVSFDPNIRTELLKGNAIEKVVAPVLENCSVLLPGKGELLALSGKETVEAAAEYLFNEHENLSIIAVKLGKEGCQVITREHSESFMAVKIEEIDPTGAGDCFDAGFLSVLLDGGTLEEAALTGSAAGALNVHAFGPMEGDINRQNIACVIASIYE